MLHLKSLIQAVNTLNFMWTIMLYLINSSIKRKVKEINMESKFLNMFLVNE